MINALDLDARTRTGFSLHAEDQEEVDLLFQKARAVVLVAVAQC
jgi:hypothetical protein